MCRSNPTGYSATLASDLSLRYGLPKIVVPEEERWNFSPTLHTPVLLQSLPRGALVGAHGVGSVAFDGLGYATGTLTSWWTIRPDGFAPIADLGNCQ